MLIDTHCHLTNGRLRRHVAGVIERARQADVGRVITVASSLADSAAGAEIAGRFDGVFCTAGIHPHEAAAAGADFLPRLEALAAGEKTVAIGEIGLDYHYNYSPPEVQREVFAAQLALAVRIDRPVVIHTREALDDTLAILTQAAPDGGQVVFHSFTGDAAEVRRVLDLGCCVGFSGIATFRKTDPIRRAAALVPDDRIMVETDAPFLSPEPVRSQRVNEPANVVHVAACLAAARGTDPDQFARLTTRNAGRFFGLDLD